MNILYFTKTVSNTNKHLYLLLFAAHFNNTNNSIMNNGY